ncbi:hypothetical protein SAMN05216388_1001243 [Halorientalis persicus]|uniref:Uncharacterized protein n=1 Tax=Halorientalis persicus TaxID=1367881 RepID=A0A1H8DBV6_9EURY|nr:hypothetical protein [Halorientalis persicus]SEN04861.1 hypothetical protein SAMN05216388_1001243 [Halorientalis persicus]
MSDDAQCAGGIERSRLREQAAMERDARDHNRKVRQRDECRVCDGDVPEKDFPTKYAAAAGCLAGPFCSSECYWRWMNS